MTFSTESLDLRRKLAYACRILAANGQNDTIYGHVSHRQAGAEHYWMKPAAMGLDVSVLGKPQLCPGSSYNPSVVVRSTSDGLGIN